MAEVRSLLNAMIDFGKGAAQPKLLIILAADKEKDQYLVCFPSRTDRSDSGDGYVPGCNTSGSRACYSIKQGSYPTTGAFKFERNTHIYLSSSSFDVFSKAELASIETKNHGIIRSDLFDSIVACIAKTTTEEHLDDMLIRHLELLGLE